MFILKTIFQVFGFSYVYFAGKNDQGDFDYSIFEDSRHNYNFIYFDEIINNSVETIELNFSELPNITSTYNIGIQDNRKLFHHIGIITS